MARPIVKRWVKKDLNAAANWVLSLPEGEAKDTGIIYVAQALVQVDTTAGMQWVEKIKNPRWKESLTKQAQVQEGKAQPGTEVQQPLEP